LINLRCAPLSHAVRENQYVAAELLLAAGADVHSRTDGFVPLFYAKNVEMAELLLRYGADINAIYTRRWVTDPLQEGNTILHNAARNHYLQPEFFTFLIERGADVLAVNQSKKLVLQS